MTKPLEDMASLLNDHFRNIRHEYELKMPVKLTVDVPKKGYRKKPFSGGETLIAEPRVRVGKRNDLIFVFTVEEGGDIVEMRVAEAMNNLNERFFNHLDEYFDGTFSKVYKAAQRGSREHTSETKRQTARDISVDHPHYGTWLAATNKHRSLR